MISLDTLRPVLLSANPYAELDRLVRADPLGGVVLVGQPDGCA